MAKAKKTVRVPSARQPGKATRARVVKEVGEAVGDLLDTFRSERPKSTRQVRLDYIEDRVIVGDGIAVLIRVGEEAHLDGD